MGGWQSIATAPRDGTRILLHPAVEVHDAWSKGHWSDQQECWLVGGSASGVTHTYWLPLPPAPPTTPAGSGKGIDMSCNLFPRFYDQLVDEDIEWLKTNAPDSLERDHILAVLEFSKREYRLRGYDEAMSKTGPHYQKDPS